MASVDLGVVARGESSAATLQLTEQPPKGRPPKGRQVCAAACQAIRGMRGSPSFAESLRWMVQRSLIAAVVAVALLASHAAAGLVTPPLVDSQRAAFENAAERMTARSVPPNASLHDALGAQLQGHGHWCGHAAAAATRDALAATEAPGSIAARKQRARAARHDAAGQRGLRQSAPPSRPLKIHWDFQLHPTTSKAEESYLRETLTPAAAAVLARSVRVRRRTPSANQIALNHRSYLATSTRACSHVMSDLSCAPWGGACAVLYGLFCLEPPRRPRANLEALPQVKAPVDTVALPLRCIEGWYDSSQGYQQFVSCKAYRADDSCVDAWVPAEHHAVEQVCPDNAYVCEDTPTGPGAAGHLPSRSHSLQSTACPPVGMHTAVCAYESLSCAEWHA